jgi:hypothetical protein
LYSSENSPGLSVILWPLDPVFLSFDRCPFSRLPPSLTPHLPAVTVRPS